ncbi:MAG: hypothetical protein PVF75_04600 [Granulosicoccaceae bacterium]|jgi:hypothetical protein
MVKRWQLFIALVLYSMTLAVRAEQLVLQTDSTETELGLPIMADLYAVASEQNLGNIDLQLLQRNYGVVIKQSADAVTDPRWPGQHIQHLRLWLYPSQTGEQIVPSLRLGQAQTTRQRIRVIEGKTRRGLIKFSSEVSSEAVWQRQQLLVTTTITTPDRYASLQAEAPVLRNVDVIPLPPRREFNADGGSTLQIGWALFPLSPGQQRIRLPAIDYRLSGVVKRKYYLPPLTIKVKALPAYLPPTIPVGKIRVSSDVTPAALLQPQRLAYWHIRLQGDKVSPLWMPPVLRQLKSDQAITFLPAGSEHSIAHAPAGIQARVSHEVPFKPADNGRTALPALRVQYFDPETARLETLRHQPQRLWVIGMGWRILLGLLLLALLSVSAKIIHDGWAAWRQRTNARRAALASLVASKDAHMLRNSLRQFACAEGWPANLSLSGWLVHWQKRYSEDEKVAGLLGELSQVSYARDQAGDIGQLKTALREAIQQARPRGRRWYALRAQT